MKILAWLIYIVWFSSKWRYGTTLLEYILLPYVSQQNKLRCYWQCCEIERNTTPSMLSVVCMVSCWTSPVGQVFCKLTREKRECHQHINGSWGSRFCLHLLRHQTLAAKSVITQICSAYQTTAIFIDTTHAHSSWNQFFIFHYTWLLYWVQLKPTTTE